MKKWTMFALWNEMKMLNTKKCRCPVDREIMGEFEYSVSKTTALVSTSLNSFPSSLNKLACFCIFIMLECFTTKLFIVGLMFVRLELTRVERYTVPKLWCSNCSDVRQELTLIPSPGNTKGGSITVPLTSCLTGLG